MGRDGVPRPDNQAVYKPEATTCPWRYPGQYEDSETGLYYNRFRYYDPEQGRYLSQDPIGLEGGLAQYGYVHDPSGWVDPFGLKPCKINRGKRKRLKAKKPAGDNWHMHHIVMEGAFTGWKAENRKFVTDARAILDKHKIDLQGDFNVVWAKNEGHSVEYAKMVFEKLSKADAKGGAGKVIEELDAIAKMFSAPSL